MPDIYERRQISLLSDRSQRYIDKEFTPNETKSFYTTKIDFFPTCISQAITRSAFLFYFIIFMLQIFFYSPLSFFSTFIPIVLTFVIEAFLNILRFIRRKKLTFEIDRRKVTVLREHSWVVIPSRALAVGDIIKLNNGDVAPADLILLWTANGGQCGIDTHIIDGSKQLKARKPNSQIAKLFTPQNLLNFYIRNINITRSFDNNHKLTSKIKFQATINPNEIEFPDINITTQNLYVLSNIGRQQFNRTIVTNQNLNFNRNNNFNNLSIINNNNNNNNDDSDHSSNNNNNNTNNINNNSRNNFNLNNLEDTKNQQIHLISNLNPNSSMNFDNVSMNQNKNIPKYSNNNTNNNINQHPANDMNTRINSPINTTDINIKNNTNSNIRQPLSPQHPQMPPLVQSAQQPRLSQRFSNQSLIPNMPPNFQAKPTLSPNSLQNRIPQLNSQTPTFPPNIRQSHPPSQNLNPATLLTNQQSSSFNRQPAPNPPSPNDIVLNNSQFIERYSVIYQVSDVICAVAFTGNDCRNVSYSERNFWGKRTKLEVLLNKQCIIQIGLVLFCATFMGIISLFYSKVNKSWPFYQNFSTHIFFLQNVWYYTVLLMPLCPLELYIIIDIVLFIHSLFISSENGTIVPNTSALDELTQIDTMILSKSLLINKKINILRVLYDGSIYGKNLNSYRNPEDVDNNTNTVNSNSNFFNSNLNDYSNLNFNLVDDDQLRTAPNTRLLFLHLAICHTAVPFIVNEYIGYISNFVEEESLLKLAEKSGYVFCGRTNSIQIKIFGIMHIFPVLITFPPSPTHPRISIIFRDVDGTIKLFTRGNIDNMREFANGIPTEAENKMKREGLQVQCCSYKIFTSEEIQNLQKNIPMILRARPESVFGFANSLEKDSIFLSLIAIQEEPRKGSLELINHAKQANIQLVLTSPFKLSWITITALSFGLIQKGEKVGVINGDNLDKVRKAVDDIYQEEIEIVGISGYSIEFLSKTENGEALFKKVKRVLIEKAEPQNVADFVSFLRSSKINKTVLGAGHSIYDSVFLEKSNLSVSVHIDSASPCDFSCDIVTNKLEEIDKLVFVHGNLIRERMNSLLHYIFPKDSVFAFFECIFGFYSAASGTPLFTVAQSFIALLTTSIPAVSRAIFNQKVLISYLKNNPDYYDKTRIENRLSGFRTVMSTILSFCAALFLVNISKLMLHNVRTPYGDTLSLSQFSFSIQSLFVVCSFCFLGPTCTTWTKLHHLSIWGSIILYFLIERALTDQDESGQMRGAAGSLTSSLIFTLVIVLFAGFSTFLTFSFILCKRRMNCVCSIDKTFCLEQYLPKIKRSMMSNFILNVEDIYRQ